MSRSTNNDVLLFDLGGVLIDVDFDMAFMIWGAYSGVPTPLLRARFSIDTCYERHERGEIDAAEYFDSLRNALGIKLTDAEFEEGWNAILGKEIKVTTALLAQLKPHIPLYLLSNSNKTHHRYWAKQFAPMLSHFERAFVSSDIGKRKPDPEVFAHVALEIGVPVARILFFDDSKENIDGAQRMGMSAIHVTSTDSVKNAVKEYFCETDFNSKE